MMVQTKNNNKMWMVKL